MGGKGTGKGKGKGKSKGKGKGKGHKKFKPECKVWIGNIADGVTWQDVQEHMNQSGKTKWCEVFDKNGAGTGFVAYGSADEAATAISALHGTELGARRLSAMFGRKKRSSLCSNFES